MPGFSFWRTLSAKSDPLREGTANAGDVFSHIYIYIFGGGRTCTARIYTLYVLDIMYTGCPNGPGPMLLVFTAIDCGQHGPNSKVYLDQSRL